MLNPIDQARLKIVYQPCLNCNCPSCTAARIEFSEVIDQQELTDRLNEIAQEKLVEALPVLG